MFDLMSRSFIFTDRNLLSDSRVDLDFIVYLSPLTVAHLTDVPEDGYLLRGIVQGYRTKLLRALSGSLTCSVNNTVTQDLSLKFHANDNLLSLDWQPMNRSPPKNKSLKLSVQPTLLWWLEFSSIKRSFIYHSLLNNKILL